MGALKAPIFLYIENSTKMIVETDMLLNSLIKFVCTKNNIQL